MAGKLQFSANLKWLFTELTLEKRYDAAAAAGFKAAEFAWPYDYPIDLFGKLLKDSGLRQVLINTPVGKPGTDKASGQACHPDSVSAFREDFFRALEYANGLDCELIHLQAGIRQKDVSGSAALETLINNVRWAGEQAKKSGISVVLEAVNLNDIPGFVVTTQAQAQHVITQAGCSNAGLLFDVYHVQRSEGDVTARMKEFYSSIKHVQVADSPGRNEPGTGELNWHFIFEQLIQLGYKGWVGCEYRPATETVEGLGWIKAHMANHY